MRKEVYTQKGIAGSHRAGLHSISLPFIGNFMFCFSRNEGLIDNEIWEKCLNFVN